MVRRSLQSATLIEQYRAPSTVGISSSEKPLAHPVPQLALMRTLFGTEILMSRLMRRRALSAASTSSARRATSR